VHRGTCAVRASALHRRSVATWSPASTGQRFSGHLQASLRATASWRVHVRVRVQGVPLMRPTAAFTVPTPWSAGCHRAHVRRCWWHVRWCGGAWLRSTCVCPRSTSPARSTSAGRITSPTCSRASIAQRPQQGDCARAAQPQHRHWPHSPPMRRNANHGRVAGRAKPSALSIDATAHQPRSPSPAPLAGGPDSSPPAPASLFTKPCPMLTKP
jgi:hypothetical protein